MLIYVVCRIPSENFSVSDVKRCVGRYFIVVWYIFVTGEFVVFVDLSASTLCFETVGLFDDRKSMWPKKLELSQTFHWDHKYLGWPLAGVRRKLLLLMLLHCMKMEIEGTGQRGWPRKIWWDCIISGWTPPWSIVSCPAWLRLTCPLTVSCRLKKVSCVLPTRGLVSPGRPAVTLGTDVLWLWDRCFVAVEQPSSWS